MMLLCAAIWGVAFSIQSLMSNSLETYTVVFLKNTGGFLLIPLAVKMKQKFSKEAIKYGIVLGIFMFFATYFQQKGIELSSVGKSSFITALYIVFVPFIAFFLGRKINKFAIIGVVIASVGMYFLCMTESFTLTKGDFYLLLCAIALALQIAYIDKFVSKVDPIPLASVQGITVAVIGFFMMLLFESPSIVSIKSSLINILYLSILSGGVAEALQITYQKDVEPTLASLFMSFESVFGALFGFILLNQVLSIRELIGCVLIFIAVLVAQKE